MDWTPIAALSGPVSVILYGAITSFVKDGGRQAAREQFADLIDAALAKHTEALFLRINGTYRRRAECDLIETAHKQRLEAAERDIHDLQCHSHHSPCEQSQAILSRLIKIEGT